MKQRLISYIYPAIILIGLLTAGALYLKKYICQSKFGAELNDRRRTLKIPIIPPNWHIKNKDEHSTWWIGKEIVIGHESKIVTYSDCELDGELDFYFFKIQQIQDRVITIEYKYINKNRNKDSVIYKYQIGDHASVITKERADSIFKAEKIVKDY